MHALAAYLSRQVAWVTIPQGTAIIYREDINWKGGDV